ARSADVVNDLRTDPISTSSEKGYEDQHSGSECYVTFAIHDSRPYQREQIVPSRGPAFELRALSSQTSTVTPTSPRPVRPHIDPHQRGRTSARQARRAAAAPSAPQHVARLEPALPLCQV